MSSLDQVHHIALHVADLDRALQWYTTSTRCEVVYRDRTQAVLQFENVRIVLVLPSMQPRHIAFVREDAASLGELCDNPDGTRSAYVSDPTGNPVEIIDPTSLG